MAKKQTPKPQAKKPVTKTPNKNMVSVGRLKQVRDSLNTSANNKASEARSKMFNGTKNLPKLKKDLNSLNSSRTSDIKTAKKYDGMIKKATKKK